MNIKRTEEEYELLFSKQDSNGNPIKDTEIAKILGVSKSSVGKARKKWLAKHKPSEEYEIVEVKEKIKDITLPIESFDNLINKTLESTSILKNERNKAEFNYFSTINSLFNKLKERNKLKEENKELDNIELKIANELDILNKLKEYLFQPKLEIKKKS